MTLLCPRTQLRAPDRATTPVFSHATSSHKSFMRCSSIFASACRAVAFGVGGSILSSVSTLAQINESSSLPEIEFSQLSQRDPNPLGENALAIHPEQWKHAETVHFIYHFVH